MKTAPADSSRKPLKILIITLVAASIILTSLIAIHEVQTSNAKIEADKQSQLKKDADEKIQIDAEKQRLQADYEKCIETANAQGVEAIKEIPQGLSIADRQRQILIIDSMIESFKNDCDRHHKA